MVRVHELSRAVLALSLVGVLSGYASAAGSSDMPRGSDQISSSQSRIEAGPGTDVRNPGLQRTSQMIGQDVKGSDGRTLGTVHDIVLTPDLSSVSYVALARGGAFGLNRDLYAIPLSAFRTGVGNTYYLPITESQIATMSGFKQAYWPTGPSSRWVAESGGAMAPALTSPTREESREVQNRRVRNLIGTNVDDAQGRNSGDIKDFVIAQDTGQVMYTVVSYGGIFGIGSRYAAVPPTAIDLSPDTRIARLTVDRDTLVAGSFPPARWPNLSSSTFEQRVASLYGTQPGGTVLGYVPPESSAAIEPSTSGRGSAGHDSSARSESSTDMGRIEDLDR